MMSMDTVLLSVVISCAFVLTLLITVIICCGSKKKVDTSKTMASSISDKSNAAQSTETDKLKANSSEAVVLKDGGTVDEEKATVVQSEVQKPIGHETNSKPQQSVQQPQQVPKDQYGTLRGINDKMQASQVKNVQPAQVQQWKKKHAVNDGGGNYLDFTPATPAQTKAKEQAANYMELTPAKGTDNTKMVKSNAYGTFQIAAAKITPTMAKKPRKSKKSGKVVDEDQYGTIQIANDKALNPTVTGKAQKASESPNQEQAKFAPRNREDDYGTMFGVGNRMQTSQKT